MYSTFFVNNKTYGADDINKVLAHLTTQGVSTFVDSGDALMDLDTAMSNLTSEGAQVYDNSGCKVVSAGNGFYKISKGCYWLASGACIIFDDEGYVFELNFLDSTGTKGTTCYVYLRQGGAESGGVSNDINIIVSGEAPADTDALLATISSAGAITDKRKVAVSKLQGYTGDPTMTISVTPQGSNTIVLVKDIPKKYGYAFDLRGNSCKTLGDKHCYPLVKLTNTFQMISYRSDYTTLEVYVRRTDEGLEFKGNYPDTFSCRLLLGDPL